MLALRLGVCDEHGSRFGDKVIVIVNWLGPGKIVVGVVVLYKGIAGDDFAPTALVRFRWMGVSHGCGKADAE